MDNIENMDLVEKLELFNKQGSLTEAWQVGSNAIVKTAFTNGTKFFKSLGNTQLDAVDTALAGALATILCGLSALFSDTASLTPQYKEYQSQFMTDSDNKEITENESKQLRRAKPLFDNSNSNRTKTFKEYYDEYKSNIKLLDDDKKVEDTLKESSGGKVQSLENKYIDFPQGIVATVPDDNKEWLFIRDYNNAVVGVQMQKNKIHMKIDGGSDKTFKDVDALVKWLNQNKYKIFLGQDSLVK